MKPWLESIRTAALVALGGLVLAASAACPARPPEGEAPGMFPLGRLSPEQIERQNVAILNVPAIAIIDLQGTRDACRVVSKSEQISVNRGGVVMFVVQNDCDAGVEVSFGGWAYREPDAVERRPGQSPLRPPDPRISVPGLDSRQRAVQVRSEEEIATGIYSFDVFVDGVEQEDPELIIRY